MEIEYQGQLYTLTLTQEAFAGENMTPRLWTIILSEPHTLDDYQLTQLCELAKAAALKINCHLTFSPSVEKAIRHVVAAATLPARHP